MAIFKQGDFSGGLNTQADATKSPDNSYPLLVNGRVRRNVVSPTKKHVKLNAPEGVYQGLYAFGEFLLLFVSGNAYYADINADPIIFYPVAPWNPMSATASRIYAELCPANSNLLTRKGSPDAITRTFEGTAAVFAQAIYVFDGVSQSAVVYADGSSELFGTYDSWTSSDPNYVPIGVLPAYASNKLFLASPDYKSIFHSVSGRASDFMVNITDDGSKGGDATTVQAAVSFNDITCIKGLSTGQVFVGTLYGSSVLDLDYANTIFGEPYLRPTFLFPTGPVNDLSLVDILEDTAFITQSGIHAFNAVAQAKRESNNYPLGAKIRGLLTDPDTDRSIIQRDTCCGLYDDYAFFSVNTIYGYGCIVYDTTTQSFQSLDLSFGRVKQFAISKLLGIERMFFITHDNQVYEAFASTEKNSTRVYLGEFTPDEAYQELFLTMVDLQFGKVRSSGECKISVYMDRELVISGVTEVAAPEYTINTPIPIPFPNKKQGVQVGFQFEKIRGWRCGVLVEWNFDGDLTDISIDGQITKADNVDLNVAIEGGKETLAFFGNSGTTTELNPGGVFAAGNYVMVAVVPGKRYVYFPNGNGVLVNGNTSVVQGVFSAKYDYVKINGTGACLFSLRLAEDYLTVLDAIHLDNNISTILHGGNFAPSAGSENDVAINLLPLRKPILGCAGRLDILTNNGKFFYAKFGERYGPETFDFVDVFFFNAEPNELDGTSSTSLQAGLLRNWVAESTRPFKIVIVNRAPYSTVENYSPGELDLRWLNADVGIHAVLSAQSGAYERIVVDDFPYFNVGTGGQPLEDFEDGTEADYRNNASFGYLRITADALTCQLDFLDTAGNILDSYALYA